MRLLPCLLGPEREECFLREPLMLHKYLLKPGHNSHPMLWLARRRKLRCKYAFMLRRRGMKFREIGERLGVCTERARQLVTRERRNLDRELALVDHALEVAFRGDPELFALCHASRLALQRNLDKVTIPLQVLETPQCACSKAT